MVQTMIEWKSLFLVIISSVFILSSRISKIKTIGFVKMSEFVLVKKNSKNSKVLTCSLLQCYFKQGKPYHPKHKSKNVLWYYERLHYMYLSCNTSKDNIRAIWFHCNWKLQLYIFSLVFLERVMWEKLQYFEEMWLLIRKNYMPLLLCRYMYKSLQKTRRFVLYY
jgi:hypothetical protein